MDEKLGEILQEVLNLGYRLGKDNSQVDFKRSLHCHQAISEIKKEYVLKKVVYVAIKDLLAGTASPEYTPIEEYPNGSECWEHVSTPAVCVLSFASECPLHPLRPIETAWTVWEQKNSDSP